MNSAWSCHVLWWFLGAIHPLLSQTGCSGKRTWPCWGSGCWKRCGHQWVRDCASPVVAREECFIGQPWGSANFKGRERVLLSKLKRPFPFLVKSTDVGLWPGHPLGSSLKAVHCVLLITWLCLVFHNLPLPPKPSLSYSWRAEIYGGTRNLGKVPSLGCSPTLFNPCKA